MSKPVILHVINSLAIGGAEVLLKDTVRRLDQFDHVICYLYEPDTLLTSFIPYPIYRINHKSWGDSRNSIGKIRGIIKAHNVQIVHAHLFEATLLARLSASSKIRFYFTIHNILSKDAFQMNRLSQFAELLTYSRNQYVISVSQEALKDYKSSIGIRGKSFVLYNYVHRKFFDLSLKSRSSVKGQFRLVAVGNLRRQKNYSNILEAFRLLKDEPFSLDIYGSGDLHEELSAIIEREGLKIRLMGRVEDISAVLPNYDAYIMGSLFEGFGIAPMEAMAAGMPVILSDLDVFREIAGDLPVYFDPVNTVSIADAVRYAYDNWEEFSQRGSRGKDMVKSIASEDVYFNNLIDIYNYSKRA